MLAYMRGVQSPAFKIRPEDGGRALSVDLDLGPEGGYRHVRLRVAVKSRVALASARARGLFTAPHGRPSGFSQQSAPGTPPHFGERAYWFGPTLGEAKAVTALERWGSEPAGAGGQRLPTEYTTVYRLPSSAAPSAPLLVGSPSPMASERSCTWTR